VAPTGDLGQDLRKVCKGADAVWIRAGILGGMRSADLNALDAYLETNVELVRHVLEACDAWNCRRVLFDSTEQVWGQPADHQTQSSQHEPAPMNFYGASKLIAEKILFDWGRKYPARSVQIFRYSRVRTIDTRDVLFHMVNSCLQGRPITLTRSSGKRIAFVDLDDVMRANLRALDLTPNRAIYQISADRPYSLLELAQLVRYAAKSHVDIELKAGTDDELEFEPYVVGMRWEETVNELGLPQPKCLDQMIRETVEHLRKAGA
jgi:UDP-glucose 4-epimerase